MSGKRILITTDYLKPGDEVDQFLRDQSYEPIYRPMGGATAQELIEALQDVIGALVANDPLTDEVLSQTPQLRAIVRTGVGYDSVDIEAAARYGITVSNLPGVNANAVAEYTLGLIIAAARRLVQSAIGVQAGGWPREDGQELRGATLGLIGYGAIAKAVVPLARAFGMRVLCSTGNLEPEPLDGVEFTDLNTLLAASDYVSIHTALNERTRGMIGAEQLQLMKPQAILINTARGPIVDENALSHAVQQGQIRGAALDVASEEPLPADSPLRAHENIVVYSHLAGQTAQARAAAGLKGARELLASLNGTPEYPVTSAE
ncbi:phosphoglycerate dehydrogenase [Nesterenkonia sp. MY13]|uniref:Phosphoglycerate dehydrogenase n=1 Tax=Nesterenkonia sedimenti TaxID=1463632 RepID=A0A7X8TIM2_9MICC|nr:phosphoglycerate dehydrogenase [Nesterenkonia sedimenti]NLS09226.1 phosphoglycerate dehydrogenase [Nesterenkonia sedimenti]